MVLKTGFSTTEGPIKAVTGFEEWTYQSFLMLGNFHNINLSYLL